MTATSSPAEPPESTLAAVVAEHVEFEWHEDADRGFWRCHCGVELNHAEPDWDASDLDAGHLHSAHVAAAILAATPTAAHVAQLEAALAAAEARLRAVEALAGHVCGRDMDSGCDGCAVVAGDSGGEF